MGTLRIGCALLVIASLVAGAEAATDYRNQALAHAQKKEWDQAIALYRKALALEPQDADTHYNLALALKYKGDSGAAILEFTEALKIRPDSPSLGPVARRLYREGATLLAVRQLVPRVFEEQLLGVDPGSLQHLRNRQALLAKELLAALDSRSDAEAERFFDPKVKDPLLPSGAGLFLADQLYQKLAGELGSTTRPLELDAGEFARRARKILLELSQAR